jgi:hypothetical protein
MKKRRKKQKSINAPIAAESALENLRQREGSCPKVRK